MPLGGHFYTAANKVKNKNKDKGVGYTRRWAFEGIVRCQGCKAKAGAIGTRF